MQVHQKLKSLPAGCLVANIFVYFAVERLEKPSGTKKRDTLVETAKEATELFYSAF